MPVLSARLTRRDWNEQEILKHLRGSRGPVRCGSSRPGSVQLRGEHQGPGQRRLLASQLESDQRDALALSRLLVRHVRIEGHGRRWLVQHRFRRRVHGRRRPGQHSLRREQYGLRRRLQRGLRLQRHGRWRRGQRSLRRLVDHIGRHPLSDLRDRLHGRGWRRIPQRLLPDHPRSRGEIRHRCRRLRQRLERRLFIGRGRSMERHERKILHGPWWGAQSGGR